MAYLRNRVPLCHGDPRNRARAMQIATGRNASYPNANRVWGTGMSPALGFGETESPVALPAQLKTTTLDWWQVAAALRPLLLAGLVATARVAHAAVPANPFPPVVFEPVIEAQPGPPVHPSSRPPVDMKEMLRPLFETETHLDSLQSVRGGDPTAAASNSVERRIASPIPTEPDWGGIFRDTGYILGYQAIAFGVLYAAPSSVSRWTPEMKRSYDLDKFVHNVTNPQFDNDSPYLNYIAHPYFGSVCYLDARGRGFSRVGSFVYSFIQSSIYEFFTEAFAEPASLQDIFVTPIGGTILGALLEGYWRDLLNQGDSRRWWGSLALFVMDPLGRTNHALDRLLGIEESEGAPRLQPDIRLMADQETYGGIELSMRW